MIRLRQGLPLHDQITDWIARKIESGDFKLDQKLPSEHELCEMFHVSRVTVRRALQTLEAEQMIYRCQGLGSFVGSGKTPQSLVRLTDFMEDMKRAGMAASSKVVWSGVEEAHGDVAAMLGVPEGMKVYRVDRLRLGDGMPVAFDMTWLPMVYGQLLDGIDLGNRTLFSILEAEYGIPIVRGRYLLSAVSADARLAGLLEVMEAQALLQLNRVAYTVSDKVVYWQKRFYRSDKVSYEILLERGQEGLTAAGGQKKSGPEPFDTAPIREITPVFRS